MYNLLNSYALTQSEESFRNIDRKKVIYFTQHQAQTVHVKWNKKKVYCLVKQKLKTTTLKIIDNVNQVCQRELGLYSSYTHLMIIKTNANPPVVSLCIAIIGSLICSQFAIMFLWVSSTPFGSPVVPLEYGRKQTSLAVLLTFFKIDLLAWISSLRSLNNAVPSGTGLSLVLTTTIGMSNWASFKASFIVGTISGNVTTIFAADSFSWRWTSSEISRRNRWVSLNFISLVFWV